MDVIEKYLQKYLASESVLHAGPYANLIVPVNPEPIPRNWVTKFIKPFYMSGFATDTETKVQAIKSDINSEFIGEMLCYGGWRERSVGSIFAGLSLSFEYETFIGNLLLRSDGPYAGASHAYALAVFNTENSINFLVKYLEYYLTKPALHFDQISVLAAIEYCSAKNKKEYFPNYDVVDEYLLSINSKFVPELKESAKRIIQILENNVISDRH